MQESTETSNYAMILNISDRLQTADGGWCVARQDMQNKRGIKTKQNRKSIKTIIVPTYYSRVHDSLYTTDNNQSV